MKRRVPLSVHVPYDGLGSPPKNRLEFKTGQDVQGFTVLRRGGSFAGAGQIVLGCPRRHEITRPASDVRRVMEGKRGPFVCPECKESIE